MSDENVRPFWPWIVALLIGLPVLYVVSFGPACWISSRIPSLTTPVQSMYTPLGKAAWELPTSAHNALYAWGRLAESDRRVSGPVLLAGMPDRLYESLTGRPRTSR